MVFIRCSDATAPYCKETVNSLALIGLGLRKRGVQFVMRIRANFKIELWHKKSKIKDRKLGLKVIRRYLSASCKAMSKRF
ncbi:MAG: hypothetical protein R2825_20725 [Saprospiraceae bacterium]